MLSIFIYEIGIWIKPFFLDFQSGIDDHIYIIIYIYINKPDQGVRVTMLSML